MDVGPVGVEVGMKTLTEKTEEIRQDMRRLEGMLARPEWGLMSWLFSVSAVMIQLRDKLNDALEPESDLQGRKNQ